MLLVSNLPSNWVLPVWSLHVLAMPAWVSSESPDIFTQCKDMQIRSSACSKFLKCEIVSGNCCLAPAVDWLHVQGDSISCLKSGGICSSFP